MTDYLLAIDQGTTSSRAIVFDKQGAICGLGQQEFAQHFPADGWVEHELEDIWASTLAVCRQALAAAGIEARQIASIGITNQRETTALWERDTGKPLGRAIVWQDRRTAAQCERLRAEGVEAMVSRRTGLLLDPYFSGTKLGWMLDNIPGAREKAERGLLAFGTIDTFLLWRLTGGKVHATDATNASRTLLYNIHRHCWDDELLSLLNIPAAVLPEVKNSADDFGTTSPELFGAAISVGALIGDQQAATV
ncbi:FGGY family carbohydrate kinase, partial [Litorivivens sp.]